MATLAHMLRPPELNSVPRYYRGDVRPFQQAALTRMTIIVVASYLVIIAFAVIAIFLGRWARRRSGNEGALARLRKWAGICLIVSLVSLGITLIFNFIFLPAIMSLHMSLPLFIAQTITTVLDQSTLIVEALIAFMAASAMGSLILSGIAVGHPHPQTARRWERWRVRISLVVSPLILLLWFALTAFLARFIVAFYLHIVY